jgi:hypothetical protein
MALQVLPKPTMTSNSTSTAPTLELVVESHQSNQLQFFSIFLLICSQDTLEEVKGEEEEISARYDDPF